MANKNQKIELTDEEQKAIYDYVGFQHAKINYLADISAERWESLKRSGFDNDISSRNIEEMINEFVNLYSAILKQGHQNPISIKRAFGIKEARYLQNKKETKSFLSCTSNKEILGVFGEYDEKSIIRIKTSKGVPYLYLEQYKKERDESEYIILPFSKISNMQEISKYDNITYYSLELEKGELPDIEIQQLENTKKECIQEYDDYQENVKLYFKLSQNIESLYERLKRPIEELEERKDISKILDEKIEERSKIYETIDIYKKKFSTMLKGFCRQKEKDIEQQKIQQQKEAEEKERKLQEEKEKEKRQQEEREKNIRQEKCKEVCTNISEQLNKLEDESKYFQEIANKLKIGYTKNIKSTDLNELKTLQLGIEKMLMKDDSLYSSEINYRMEQFPNIINEYVIQANKEIKANLNFKVQNLISQIKLQNLETQKLYITEQNVTWLQGLFGAEKLKQVRLENIDAKIKLVQKEGQNRNPKNSTKVMLQNLYDCAIEQCGGNFTNEMKEIWNNIITIFNKSNVVQQTPIEQSNGALVLYEQKRFGPFKTKKEIEKIDRDTQSVIYKTNQLSNTFSSYKVDREPLQEFRKNIKIIHNIVKRNQEQKEEKKEIEIENKDGGVINEDYTK